MTTPRGGIVPDANGNVPVAGLLVPAPLVPRIVAAVRHLYPTLTEGLEDDAAVRAWLKWMVTVTMSQSEGQRAAAPVDAALEATRQEFAQRAEEARARAVRDAAAIVDGLTPGSGAVPAVEPRA